MPSLVCSPLPVQALGLWQRCLELHQGRAARKRPAAQPSCLHRCWGACSRKLAREGAPKQPAVLRPALATQSQPRGAVLGIPTRPAALWAPTETTMFGSLIHKAAAQVRASLCALLARSHALPTAATVLTMLLVARGTPHTVTHTTAERFVFGVARELPLPLQAYCCCRARAPRSASQGCQSPTGERRRHQQASIHVHQHAWTQRCLQPVGHSSSN